MDSCTEFLELAQQLNQERLFVASERQHLQILNEKVLRTVERLFSAAWITKQQRINLDGLIFSKPDSTPSACCQRANILEDAQFVDCYKHLGIHEAEYGEFLQALRNKPELISMYLTAGERLNTTTMHHMVNVIVDSLYGHCLLQEDERLVLQLLKHLMEIQLSTNENPRRLLRHGTCAFSRVYRVFNEGLFSAKLFLTGALHEPIMNLLMEDDLFLDIDPSKAAVRFPQQERLRRFGKEGTTQYITNLQKYRNWTIVKLVNLTNKFVAGIRNNLHCFPSSLLWLVKQLYNLVMKAQKVEVREVGAMCADLVFAFFICPAIVNPEPYGICDAHISYIARFNLMQVAQILQVLAMAKWEEIDPKLMDLYGKFDRNCMSSVLDLLLEGGVENVPPVGPQVPGLIRTAMLITESDLHSLIRFLLQIQNDVAIENWIDKKSMQKILDFLPKSALSLSQINGHNATESSSNVANSPQTPTLNSKKSLLGKVGKSKTKSNSTIADDHGPTNGLNRTTDSEESSLNTSALEIEEVLVVTLNVISENPGMLSESKVLAMEQVKRKIHLDANDEDISTHSVIGEMQEKRTRFSLSQDQDSIGNTSDNFEAISEAASNHSVSSSLELENENENDNLSDMISANVSGRGTPNVSGRDTPSSQVGGDERDCDGQGAPRLDLPVTAQKQNREDISDKFGKFEIKNLIGGDETISLVSDTWSTDVLASDSETVEQADRSQEEQGFRRNVMAPNLGQNLEFAEGLLTNARNRGVPTQDLTETASEAWSTDVLASDSERLQDVDTDDTGSIARSDDTASLYRSDDIPSRIDVVISNSDSKSSDADAFACVDVCDQGDSNVTPRASGVHSPVDGPNNSGSSASWIHTLHRTVGFKPISDSEFSQINGVENGQRDESAAFREYSEFEESQNGPGFNNSRFSDNLNYMNGKAANIASFFDPLANGNFANCSNNEVLGETYFPLSDDTDGTNGQNLTLTPSQPAAFNDSSVFEKPNSASEKPIPNSFSDYSLISNNGTLIANSSSMIVETDITEFPLTIKEDHEFEQVNDDVGCSYHESGQRSGASFSTNVLKSNLNGGNSLRSNITERSPPILLTSSTSSVKSTCMSVSSSAGSSNSSNCSLPGESSNMRINGCASLNVQPNRDATDGNGESGMMTESLPLPTAASGAIPKSISFDKTAEKGDKELMDNDDPKNKKSFFRSLKMSLKRPSKRNTRYHEEKAGCDSQKDDLSYNSRKFHNDIEKSSQESSDDILAKYRHKSSYRSSSSSSVNDGSLRDKSLPVSPPIDDNEEEVLILGQDNFEESYAFSDAKRKLRLVLSTADVQTVPWFDNSIAFRMEGSSSKNDSKLVGFLKKQLAEAINLQDRSLAAQLHETLRCVSIFDKTGCNKLFNSLREDYKNRHPYIAYLIQSRQSFLFALSHLERLMKRVDRDKAVCNKYMISVCVRLFLEKVERLVQRFIEEFQNLTVSDEKTDFLEQFLQFLYKQMETEPIWQGASSSQLDQAKGAIERSIMGKLYVNALYPNGDGDVHRDQVLNEHIQKLSNVITPNHKDLRISKMYHYECPWPSAQAEIKTINAYKTPGDKLQCVVRCCTTIMNLLSMANQKSVPAADDFIPVLVFIIIKANPTNLLSTIQYVNSFYEKQLKGEDEYWWTQFCSAVEFIKTMDYTLN